MEGEDELVEPVSGLKHTRAQTFADKSSKAGGKENTRPQSSPPLSPCPSALPPSPIVMGHASFASTVPPPVLLLAVQNKDEDREEVLRVALGHP